MDINTLIIKKIILDEIKNPENHTYHYINNVDDIEIIHHGSIVAYPKLSVKMTEGKGFYIDFLIKNQVAKKIFILGITYKKYLREEILNKLLNEI